MNENGETGLTAYQPILPLLWHGDSISYLDQRTLPFDVLFSRAYDYREVIAAIRTLAIRGAPLIGIAAAYGVALAAIQTAPADATIPMQEYQKRLLTVCDEFAASRPTAVNLFWALNKARDIISHQNRTDLLRESLIRLAADLHEDDRARCRAIGEHGATLLPDGGNIITHCNAGALATGGEGTALNVIRVAHRQTGRIHVFVDETRPLLQGARLTTWELRAGGIPHTLITDSTAACVMQNHLVAAVLIGADRIAANGDTANKVGSYALALLAKAHGIPFYVAAPLSTFDTSLATGSSIPIEVRHAEEVLTCAGAPVAIPDTPVFCPAFDVTPHRLITAFITEAGIVRPSSGIQDSYTGSIAAVAGTSTDAR